MIISTMLTMNLLKLSSSINKYIFKLKMYKSNNSSMSSNNVMSARARANCAAAQFIANQSQSNSNQSKSNSNQSKSNSNPSYTIVTSAPLPSNLMSPRAKANYASQLISNNSSTDVSVRNFKPTFVTNTTYVTNVNITNNKNIYKK